MAVLVTSYNYEQKEITGNSYFCFNNYKAMIKNQLKNNILPCSFYDLAGLSNEDVLNIKHRIGETMFTSNTVVTTPNGTFITTRGENPIIKHMATLETINRAVKDYPAHSYNGIYEVSEWAAAEIENMAEEDKNKLPSERRIFKVPRMLPKNIEDMLEGCTEEIRNYLIEENKINVWKIEDYMNEPIIQFLFKDRISAFPMLNMELIQNKISGTSKKPALKFSFKYQKKYAQCSRVLKPLVYHEGIIAPLMCAYANKRNINMAPIGIIN